MFTDAKSMYLLASDPEIYICKHIGLLRALWIYSVCLSMHSVSMYAQVLFVLYRTVRGNGGSTLQVSSSTEVIYMIMNTQIYSESCKCHLKGQYVTLSCVIFAETVTIF